MVRSTIIRKKIQLLIVLLCNCYSYNHAFLAVDVLSEVTIIAARTRTDLFRLSSTQPRKKNLNNSDQESSRRWNGSYKYVSKKLCDIPKAKKLKIDLSANGITKTLEKKRMESVQHVLTKAVLWKVFMDEGYHNLQIEHDIGDPNYLPDVVGLDDKEKNNDDAVTQQPILFWGESGRMKVHKAVDLLKRYPDTHIVHCRWGMDIETISQPLLKYLQKEYNDGNSLEYLSNRKGRFTFASIPFDVWRFIDEDTREVFVTKQDLEWKDLEFPKH